MAREALPDEDTHQLNYLPPKNNGIARGIIKLSQLQYVVDVRKVPSFLGWPRRGSGQVIRHAPTV